MKFSKILVAAYALMASVGAMAVGVVGSCDPQQTTCPLGTPVDDLALLGLAVAALAAGVGIIRRKK
jgi:hypothetical protein